MDENSREGNRHLRKGRTIQLMDFPNYVMCWLAGPIA